MKKISRFEYALFDALGRQDLIAGCEAKSEEEEIAERRENIKSQTDRIKVKSSDKRAN